MKVGVIDYGGGNIRSVLQALRALGQDPQLVPGPDELSGLDSLVFPGQGAFGSCMDALRKRDLAHPVQDWISSDRPFFGICVGYQLLFQSSEESPGATGLGIFEGEVVRFPPTELKVPQMGWNSAHVEKSGSRYWQGLGEDPYFYFVHSYYPAPTDSSIVATTTDFGLPYASAVEKGNLIATQFHPEKSQRAGLRLLANFLGVESASTAHVV